MLLSRKLELKNMKKSFVMIVVAMLAIGSLGLVSFAGADMQMDRTWVRGNGIIQQWGETPVFGWLNVRAYVADVNGTHHEWAQAHAMWSNEPCRLNCSTPPTENFTFSFYNARLTNATTIDLANPAYVLFIAGSWTVVKVTMEIYVNEYGEPINITKTLEFVLNDAYGELHVFPPLQPHAPSLFELNIDGINSLSGFMRFMMMRHMEMRMCDVNDDGKVDIRELVRAAKRYRAAPGMLNYDFEMDFNFDFQIDIGDLTTIAANIEG